MTPIRLLALLMLTPACLAGTRITATHVFHGLVHIPADGKWYCHEAGGLAAGPVELRMRREAPSSLDVRETCQGIRDSGPVSRLDQKDGSFVGDLPQVRIRGHWAVSLVQRVRGVRALVDLGPRRNAAAQPPIMLSDLDLAGYSIRGFSKLKNYDELLLDIDAHAAGRDPSREQLAYERSMFPEIELEPVLLVDADPLPRGFRLEKDRLVWGHGRFELRQWAERTDDRPLRGFIFIDRIRRTLVHWATWLSSEVWSRLIRMVTRGDRILYEHVLLDARGLALAPLDEHGFPGFPRE